MMPDMNECMNDMDDEDHNGMYPIY